MLKILLERMRQKFRTHPFPKKEVNISDRVVGHPIIVQKKCSHCHECINVCPTNALTFIDNKLTIDLGRCLFCNECAIACKHNGISFTNDYRLMRSSKSALLFSNDEIILGTKLSAKILSMFGRSLKLRQVSCGGCNACEADINVLNTLFFDLQRFGIQIVASPRHADGLIVTGPVTKNMEVALKKTYDSLADPKIVIAVGSCSISGEPFIKSGDVVGGVDLVIPVDIFIPGCPPHPMTILDGLLRALNKY